jgi:hypothetical protein
VGLPSYCYWTYGAEYLPPTFHTEQGFEDDMKNIGRIALNLSTLSPAIILGFGLAIREAQHCQYLEPGEPIQDGMPMYVFRSFACQETVQQVLEFINKVIAVMV